MQDHVVFKGKNDWLELTLSPDIAFGQVIAELKARLCSNQTFFAGSSPRVYVVGRALTKRQKDALRECLLSAGRLESLEFENDSNVTLLKPVLVAEEHPREAVKAPESMFIRRTLRSGQSVSATGDVCVLGDINDGAQVFAGGDIVVMGVVRGLVHAGMSGDEQACVVALSIHSKQLRIAGYIAAAPDGPVEIAQGPEIARIRHGNIVIEAYGAQRGQYGTDNNILG